MSTQTTDDQFASALAANAHRLMAIAEEVRGVGEVSAPHFEEIHLRTGEVQRLLPAGWRWQVVEQPDAAPNLTETIECLRAHSERMGVSPAFQLIDRAFSLLEDAQRIEAGGEPVHSWPELDR